jgi:hypothetical protein
MEHHIIPLASIYRLTQWAVRCLQYDVQDPVHESLGIIREKERKRERDLDPSQA